MYDYGRGSVRKRALRIAQQRGWIGGGRGGMVLPIVLVVVAVLAALWLVSTVVFWLLPMAIVGLLTGWAASKLTGARLSLGWTILAGVAGSWLGGAIFSLVGIPGSGLLMHLVASVLGAAILITFARALSRPSLPGASRPRLGRTY